MFEQQSGKCRKSSCLWIFLFNISRCSLPICSSVVKEFIGLHYRTFTEGNVLPSIISAVIAWSAAALMPRGARESRPWSTESRRVHVTPWLWKNPFLGRVEDISRGCASPAVWSWKGFLPTAWSCCFCSISDWPSILNLCQWPFCLAESAPSTAPPTPSTLWLRPARGEEDGPHHYR